MNVCGECSLVLYVRTIGDIGCDDSNVVVADGGIPVGCKCNFGVQCGGYN